MQSCNPRGGIHDVGIGNESAAQGIFAYDIDYTAIPLENAAYVSHNTPHIVHAPYQNRLLSVLQSWLHVETGQNSSNVFVISGILSYLGTDGNRSEVA